ncbi:MAG: malonyl-[acyl-carrier protein] O-methyltransferase BioC [Methylophaga sp.]|nr:MAG: malonyl-[acyl-carrier protein] O-methyltransferase BioC [Methylophaga sp.]
MNKQLPNKTLVAKSFGQAAANYDDVAVLQRQTADELLERLLLVKLQPECILDLGTGTGRNLDLLAKRYPQAQLIAVDIAPAMLQQAKMNYQQAQGLKRWLPTKNKPIYLTGDAEKLPLADNSVDLIFTNLTLQWCDPRTSFAEIQRVLRPNGLLMFTSLGPDTLHELRQSWATVDDYTHVNMFYDMHDVGEAMMSAGLAEPVLDTDRFILSYDTSMALMKDLKVLGAHNVNADRRRGLTGKQALNQVAIAYEQFRKNKILPATYEVVYGHAWGSDKNNQQVANDGSISIPVSQIQRRRTS